MIWQLPYLPVLPLIEHKWLMYNLAIARLSDQELSDLFWKCLES